MGSRIWAVGRDISICISIVSGGHQKVQEGERGGQPIHHGVSCVCGRSTEVAAE